MKALAMVEPEPIRPELYRGIPVLRMHVDDPIPAPRAPERYAVHVSPDLARYLLTFNHPHNRTKKSTAIAKYARDFAGGYWAFTPESLIFSQGGVLQNGQNRLYGIIEAGVPAWLMLDFGWPEDLLLVIDRGAARTNADGLHTENVPNASVLSGACTIAWRWQKTVGTPLHWSSSTRTSSEVREFVHEAPELWQTAVLHGRRTYDATLGLGPSTWVAAYFLIAHIRGEEDATLFMDEVAQGTGEPGSPTRRLKDLYLRRKIKDTASGDAREPIENIIRAFNAWAGGRPVGFIRTGGAFVLSPIRKSA